MQESLSSTTSPNFYIQEIQRVSNILPHNLLHRVTKDVVINGHTIREGTAIVPQISVPLIDDQVRFCALKSEIEGEYYLKIYSNF